MPSKPKPRHTLRLVEAPGIGPLTAWRDLKPNSLLWLRWFLENGGALPASCHFVIAERLQPFIAAVTARPELRDELLATVLPIPTREPEPPRHWIMPSIGKTISAGRFANGDADPVSAGNYRVQTGPPSASCAPPLDRRMRDLRDRV